jgi:hypothetical protein
VAGFEERRTVAEATGSGSIERVDWLISEPSFAVLGTRMRHPIAMSAITTPTRSNDIQARNVEPFYPRERDLR